MFIADSPFLSLCLHVSLVIFLVGLVFKVGTWFQHQIDTGGERFPVGVRVLAAVRGGVGVLFGPKLIDFVKIFFLDVLLNRRVLKEDFRRWLMHMLIYVGFTLLVVTHALGAVIMPRFFPGYASTILPYIYLRNLFGVAALAGLGIALYRRRAIPGMRVTTGDQDRYALAILAIIIMSGFLMEATKIVSHARYDDMVAQYGDTVTSDEDKESLRAYWTEEFGVIFPESGVTADAAVMRRGEELHQMNCAGCHSTPDWAFVSYWVAKKIRPAALGLTSAGAAIWLWYVHVLACLVGLAYLPFSKFFHMVAGPVSLLVNGIMAKGKTDPANVATRRIMELDACTHCGTCSVRCSVNVIFWEMHTLTILPSEKLKALKSLAFDQPLTQRDLRIIQEGSHICTGCHRCTDVCPVGINLQDLWLSMNDLLALKGFPEPAVSARQKVAAYYAQKDKDRELIVLPDDGFFQQELSSSIQAPTFWSCYRCQTCTNACPVVANCHDPVAELGLLPHQIMHALALGLKDEALAAGMTWDCLTCYMCQEYCPQGVHVADVLYELRNMAYRDFRAGFAPLKT
ncbi:MAG: 4Fe-4S dicluster domain-containing protein [Deltaproteobacteria bacterium]|nr:4Fe-4S dicluster domain-containing protein [Deltaproteobacteria bacterium]